MDANDLLRGPVPKGVNYPLYIPQSCADVAQLIESSGKDAAIELLRKKALFGNHSAAALLAYIHLRGGAPKEECKEAFEKCRIAADAGEPYAEFVLGQIHLSAGNVPEALEWWQKSCNHLFAPALSHMGRMLTTGRGFPAPARRGAMRMYRLALKRRHVPALVFLAKHLLASRNPFMWFAGLLLSPIAFLIGVITFQFAPFKEEIFAHISSNDPPLFSERRSLRQ